MYFCTKNLNFRYFLDPITLLWFFLWFFLKITCFFKDFDIHLISIKQFRFKLLSLKFFFRRIASLVWHVRREKTWIAKRSARPTEKWDVNTEAGRWLTASCCELLRNISSDLSWRNVINVSMWVGKRTLSREIPAIRGLLFPLHYKATLSPVYQEIVGMIIYHMPLWRYV